MALVQLNAHATRILHRLAYILLAKQYFSFKKDALKYADDLKNFVYSIPAQKHYTTKLPKYGKFYARYKPNKHTTYYITFDKIDEKYLIKNIITNHTPQYPRYIKGKK